MENKALFIDTSFVYALINPHDQWHEKSVVWQQKAAAARRPLITTQFILIEIADGLSSPRFRAEAARVIHTIENSGVDIILASSELFTKSLRLFEERSDKSWGLTDCSSFIVMRENGLMDALTTDNHFRQAGFNALLLD